MTNHSFHCQASVKENSDCIPDHLDTKSIRKFQTIAFLTDYPELDTNYLKLSTDSLELSTKPVNLSRRPPSFSRRRSFPVLKTSKQRREAGARSARGLNPTETSVSAGRRKNAPKNPLFPKSVHCSYGKKCSHRWRVYLWENSAISP